MEKYAIGVYGLGVMGSSLAKNIISKGFPTALYNKEEQARAQFQYQGKYCVFENEKKFVESLASPKIIFIMVTAGTVVDSVINSLIPILDKGDIIIDGGNSYYSDTSRRFLHLDEKGLRYLGIGVSGGEKGAFLGPSMMVGGSFSAWEDTKHILQNIAAKIGEDYCCDYVGKEGAGHYVKMVHNGIEYAIIQLIADVYHIMKNGLHLSHPEIVDIFSGWKDTELDSYLIDITVAVLKKMDDDGAPLVDKILDVAKQKGTGSWTLIEAIQRGVCVPTISEAVFARCFSGEKESRIKGSKCLKATKKRMVLENPEQQLKAALTVGILCSYAQGIELIKKASQDFNWNIDLKNTAALWRQGCIIRSAMLGQITDALAQDDENLLLSESFSYVNELEKKLRIVSQEAIMAALAVPTFLSVISYYDCLRTEHMQVNLVQALRDCFGAHSYERIDKDGNFHSNWEE